MSETSETGPQEDEPSPGAFTKYLYESMGDPAIETIFCNRMVTLIQDSNVLLYLGVESPRGGDDRSDMTKIRYSTCMVMSHAYFMDSMRYMAAKWFIREVFEDFPEPPRPDSGEPAPDLPKQLPVPPGLGARGPRRSVVESLGTSRMNH